MTIDRHLVDLPLEPWPAGYEAPEDPTFVFVPPWTAESAARAAGVIEDSLRCVQLASRTDSVSTLRAGRAVFRGLHVLGCHGYEDIECLQPQSAYLLPGSNPVAEPLVQRQVVGRDQIDEAARVLTYSAGVLFRAVAGAAWAWPAIRPLTAVMPDWYDARLSRQYDVHRPRQVEYAAGLHQLAGLLSGADVLEVGAGTGRTAALLQRFCHTYTATEASESMLAILKTRLRHRGRARWADAMDLPFPERSFDVVIEETSFAFTQEPLVAAQQAVRVLRPGGLLVRLVPGPVRPDQDELLTRVREELRLEGCPRLPIWGKANRERVTDYLDVLGFATRKLTLGEWKERYFARDVRRLAEDRALPYLAIASERQIQAACHRVFERVRNDDTEFSGENSLVALVSEKRP